MVTDVDADVDAATVLVNRWLCCDVFGGLVVCIKVINIVGIAVKFKDGFHELACCMSPPLIVLYIPLQPSKR